MIQDLCKGLRVKLAELDELLEGVDDSEAPAVRSYTKARRKLLTEIEQLVAGQGKKAYRVRVEYLEFVEHDLAGKVLLVALDDPLGSQLATGSTEVGANTSTRWVMPEPLALVDSWALVKIPIADRQRVLVCRNPDANLYESLQASSARYPYEVCTRVLATCSSRKALEQWLTTTRDVRHRRVLVGRLEQLARVAAAAE
jgi:hypothetical protein